jgi:hypothetical protein
MTVADTKYLFIVIFPTTILDQNKLTSGNSEVQFPNSSILPDLATQHRVDIRRTSFWFASRLKKQRDC